MKDIVLRKERIFWLFHGWSSFSDYYYYFIIMKLLKVIFMYGTGISRWRGIAMGRALDLRSTARGFKSFVTKQYNLVPAKRRWYSVAGKVTTGVAESNGSLPLAGWLTVTRGLTACALGSAPGPALSNKYGKPLHFFTGISKSAWRVWYWMKKSLRVYMVVSMFLSLLQWFDPVGLVTGWASDSYKNSATCQPRFFSGMNGEIKLSRYRQSQVYMANSH